MADLITKLKVDSKEYDAKISRARQGIMQLDASLKDAGKTFADADKAQTQFIRDLGNMGTVSQGARRQLSELKQTYEDLAVMYQRMSEEEKKSAPGQALASSLGQLRERINETKQQLDDVGRSMGTTKSESSGLGGALEQLAGKFGVNVKQLTLLGGAMAATTAAVKVAKDAFFASETNVDDWGRTVEGAGSLYQSFLQTLNTGDFSGFMQRINDVIGKAKEAYNAMDTLGTVMTIVNPERAKLQARATELKATIRRAGAGSAEGQAAQQQLLALEPQLQQSYKVESKLNYNAFVSEVDKKLAEAGIKLGNASKNFLLKTFSSTEAYEALKANAAGEASKRVSVETPWGRGVRQTEDTRNVNQKLLDLFDDEWRRKYSPYLSASYSARGAAASTMLGDARYIRPAAGGGGGGGGGGAGTPEEYVVGGIDGLKAMSGVGMEAFGAIKSLNQLNIELKRYNELMARAKTATEYNSASILAASTKKRIGAQGGVMSLGIDSESKAEVYAEMSAFGEELRNQIKPIEIKVDAAKNLSKIGEQTMGAWNKAAAAISSAGSALQGLEDPGAKVAGIVAQAVANIALGFAQAAASPATGVEGVFGWIAAATAGVATMVATIQSIRQATSGFAEGGVVPGNSYSGDNMLYGLNTGEVVLNRAQTANVAAQLTQAGSGQVARPSYVSGENVYVGTNNYLRRAGKGEIVTTKMLGRMLQ